ncbi:MAG TPA: phosphotransferase [Verrucomicrobiae bacterium]|nr:phosphotransferase [Verrucomicrobiae bacterium]
MPSLEDKLAEEVRRALGPSARIAALSPLAGDASSRLYYRARLENSTGPQSLIVMELAGSSLPLSSEELAIFSEAPKELPFLNVRRFFESAGVRVPALYATSADQSLLLLEDLGDRLLWDSVQGIPSEAVLRWYEKAIDQLLLIQVEGTRRRDDACIAFQQRFDFRLYMWEFEHFIEYGLDKRPRVDISDADKARLRESFTEIARRLDALFPCLSHRDYHSWNLMAHDGEIAVIDFQDALLAPPQYDLASLLNDRETDRVIDSDSERRLIDYFLRRRADLGAAPVDKSQFFDGYILSALQRDFKVVGRFYYLDVVKGKPGYKKYIPPTLRRLRRNLERTTSFKHLVPIMAGQFEEF